MTQAHSQPDDSGTHNSNASTLGATMSQNDVQPDAHQPEVQAEPGSLLALVLDHLDDDQAQNVVAIPLEGKSSIADYMVIASGRSTRQVASIAQKLAESVKHSGFGPVRLEGLPQADWVLVDAGDVVVHLFRPEVRSFYNLERMWAFGDAPPVGAGSA